MSATYYPDLPRPLDEVRRWIGDVYERAAFYTDAAIEAELARANGNVLTAALTLAQRRDAALATQPVRTSADGVSVDYGDRRDALRETTRQIEAAISGGAAEPLRSQSRSVTVVF